SSNIVFPDPGEETRLKAVMSCSASRRRTSLASSSFFAITRSRTSIVRIVIIHLVEVDAKVGSGARNQFSTSRTEGGLRQEHVEAEREVGGLETGVIAHDHADTTQVRLLTRRESLLDQAADLEGHTEFMHTEPMADGRWRMGEELRRSPADR